MLVRLMTWLGELLSGCLLNGSLPETIVRVTIVANLDTIYLLYGLPLVMGLPLSFLVLPVSVLW